MKIITKDNKGITLVALIITVILTLILISVTTYTGVDTYKNAKVTKFVAQMQLLQTKIDDLVTTKTVEELNNMQLKSVTTEKQENAINSAYEKEKITTNEIGKYKVFTKDDVLNILDIEDVNNDIIVNFETREIISTVGVKYKGEIYYTQYKLPNGQAIINNKSNLRELTFEIVPSIDGLNCTIAIDKISINNGTLTYAETDQQENKSNLKTVTNYTEKNKSYTVNISKSGIYTFELKDNADNNSFEKRMIITLTNKPKTTIDIDTYNYGKEDSDTWAYAQKDSVNYVWIPRFAYKTNPETNAIEVKFIKGNSNIATDNTYVDDTWNIHEKFTTSNGVNLTGIWVKIDNLKQTELDMLTLLESDADTLIEI